RATFRAAYGNAGLSPDGGLTWTLPRLVGRAAAIRLTLRDTAVTAEEALDLGLVDDVADDDSVLEVAVALAAEIADRPGEAVAAAKRLLDTGWTDTREAHLEEERAAIVAAGRTEGHRQALARFLDR
ncbi:MAG TPA: enoyl-CoA hydratase-related protein, partial [Acidimicrobiia bacterium]|nr:enoyl-CoA hydratase-related protein [Acidimicrobiia bacterium]